MRILRWLLLHTDQFIFACEWCGWDMRVKANEDWVEERCRCGLRYKLRVQVQVAEEGRVVD